MIQISPGGPTPNCRLASTSRPSSVPPYLTWRWSISTRSRRSVTSSRRSSTWAEVHQPRTSTMIERGPHAMAAKLRTPMSSQRRRRARRRCHHCSGIESCCDDATAVQLPGQVRTVALLRARSVYHEWAGRQNGCARWGCDAVRQVGPATAGPGWNLRWGSPCSPHLTPSALRAHSGRPLRTTHGNRGSCARGGHGARRLEACATIVMAARPLSGAQWAGMEAAAPPYDSRQPRQLRSWRA